MSQNTNIQWTDASWNPTTGCDKVSKGCRLCYAEKEWVRLSKNPKSIYFGREFTDIQCHGERLDWPMKLKKPHMIFVDSMSDLFHEKVPGYFIDDVFATMSACPQHIFQILTKRPERMKQHLIEKHYSNRFREDYGYKGPWPLPNVWIGTSVENQETADERIPILLDIPAAIRWLSIEPQLGDIDLQPFFEQWPDHNGVRIVQNSNGVDWVVVGGESGKTSKVVPYCLSWTRNVIHDCRNAGVPLFVKQLGRRPYDIPEDYDGDDWPIWLEYKLKHLKGGDWDEWPDDYLKIREYPEL